MIPKHTLQLRVYYNDSVYFTDLFKSTHDISHNDSKLILFFSMI